MPYLLHMLQSGIAVTPVPSPANITCANFPPACITDLTVLSNILMPLIYLGAAALLFILLIYSAFVYLQNSGEASEVANAQNTLKYAIVGIFVIVIAYFLVRLIAYILDIPFLL